MCIWPILESGAGSPEGNEWKILQLNVTDLKGSVWQMLELKTANAVSCSKS